MVCWDLVLFALIFVDYQQGWDSVIQGSSEIHNH